MNLDVHVYTTRAGRHRARCTGTVLGVQLTARSSGRTSAQDAAGAAVALWLVEAEKRRAAARQGAA